MRDVAIVAVGQSPQERRRDHQNEVEMLMPVAHDLFEQVGLTLPEIDFTVSGSTDYLAGMAFSFVTTRTAKGRLPRKRPASSSPGSCFRMFVISLVRLRSNNTIS